MLGTRPKDYDFICVYVKEMCYYNTHISGTRNKRCTGQILHEILHRLYLLFLRDSIGSQTLGTGEQVWKTYFLRRSNAYLVSEHWFLHVPLSNIHMLDVRGICPFMASNCKRTCRYLRLMIKLSRLRLYLSI